MRSASSFASLPEQTKKQTERGSGSFSASRSAYRTIDGWR